MQNTSVSLTNAQLTSLYKILFEIASGSFTVTDAIIGEAPISQAVDSPSNSS